MTANNSIMKGGLLALVAHFGIATSALAGGPGILELPIEGVTAENSATCLQLLREGTKDHLGGGTVGAVNIKDTPDGAVVRMQLGMGLLSLAQIEKVLQGSPFSIHRERLEFHGVARLKVKNVRDLEATMSTLRKLGGRDLVVHSIPLASGMHSIAVGGPGGGQAVLFGYGEIRRALASQGAELVSVLWGTARDTRERIEHPALAFHCRQAFGARRIRTETTTAAAPPRG